MIPNDVCTGGTAGAWNSNTSIAASWKARSFMSKQKVGVATQPAVKTETPRPRSAQAPKYGVLADAFRQRITRGDWPPGYRLAPLDVLAQQHGVARLTARQAVQVLVQQGWLESTPGRGTRVMAHTAHVQRVQLQTRLVDLARMYQETPPQIHTLSESVGPLPASCRRDDTRYVCLQRVHADAGQPYCTIDVYVDQSVFRRAAQRFRRRAAIPVLVSLPGVAIASARQVLTVGVADPRVAALLTIPVNAPVVFVERVFQDAAQRIVYYAHVVYRGDAVQLDIDLVV